jgi:hypothetical protein
MRYPRGSTHLSKGFRMIMEPDYSKWLSVEAISPHEFACLGLGIEPTPIPAGADPRSAHCPAMPEEIADDLDAADWKAAYERVYTVLSRAIEEGTFPTTPTGRIKLAGGVGHLTAVAEMCGWSEQLSPSPFIKKANALTGKGRSIEDALQARISELEDELARYKTLHAYSTPMLEMVKVVIDHFYASGDDYPKQEVVFEFLRERRQLSDGTMLSQAKIESIWAVASHPSQAKGGQKARKKC